MMSNPAWQRIDRLGEVELERELIAAVFAGNSGAYSHWLREHAEFEALNTHKSVATLKRMKLFRATSSGAG
jgi:hypothetical protein